jgi:hypothetical protein
MPNTAFPISTVCARFFQPVADVFSQLLTSQRNCPQFSDPDFIEMGLARVLSNAASGRDFLQSHAEAGRLRLSVGHFFETLKSPRRLALCRELSRCLQQSVSRVCEDPFRPFPELADFDLYAGDGHCHAAAAHDKAMGDSRQPVGHLFTLNLRSRALHHLTLGETGGTRKREHDMHALKRLDLDELRHHAKKGRKAMMVWDRAGIDFRFWHKAKQNGLYFVSRDKDNMRLETIGLMPFDKKDPRNQGVLIDDIVSTSQGVAVRRVVYYDAIGDVTYTYLTSEMTLPPGLIALLYKRRWDIEKAFDEAKNKYHERKAWASSPTAKMIQGQFIAMTHNLMLVIEADLEKNEQVRNEPELARRAKRLAKIKTDLAKKGIAVPFVYSAITNLTQRGVKLIRWLRNHLYGTRPWTDAVSHLRRLYAAL